MKRRSAIKAILVAPWVPAVLESYRGVGADLPPYDRVTTYVSATPPGMIPVTGDLWFDVDTGEMYRWSDRRSWELVG